jgi:hypothetical protein
MKRTIRNDKDPRQTTISSFMVQREPEIQKEKEESKELVKVPELEPLAKL